MIEYGLAEDFNHQQEGIYNLLSKYDCEVYASNCEDPCYAESFEVPRDHIARMLKRLKRRSPRGVALRDSGYLRDPSVKWTVRDVIDFFQDAYDHSPKEQSVIHFEWF